MSNNYSTDLSVTVIENRRSFLSRLRANLAVPVCSLLALSACTTSLSVREDTATPTAAMSGIPYQLPEKKASLEVTWTLTACHFQDAKQRSARIPVDIEASAALSTSIIEGPTLVIDYTRMTNRFKSGSLIVDYYVGDDKIPTRIIKSINADIKGEEPAALKSAISAAVKVAKIAIGLPPSLTAKGGPKDGKPVSACMEDTLESINALKDLQKQNEDDIAKSGKLSARIAVLLARAVGGELTPADEKEAEEIYNTIDVLTALIETRKSAVKVLKDRLSYTEKFDPDIGIETVQPFQPNEAKFKKWLSTLVEKDLPGPNPVAPFSLNFTAKMVATKKLPSAPEQSGTGGRQKRNTYSGSSKVSATTRSWPGYLYRDPINVMVTVKAGQGTEEKTIIEQIERVPQLGNLRLLPLRSRWGEHNTLIADFAPDGVPTKVEYKTPTASGVAMLESLDSAAGGALEISGLLADRKAKRKAERDGASAAALADLKVEVDTLEQRKKLLELQNGPVQEVADLNAQLAVLRLQKEQAELQAAIRNAKATDD